MQVIKRKLESPISLPIYTCKRAAVTASGGQEAKEQLLRAGVGKGKGQG